MTPGEILQLVSMIGVCGAIYGGIRADLKAMHKRVEEALRSAARAHDRIDFIADRRKNNDH